MPTTDQGEQPTKTGLDDLLSSFLQVLNDAGDRVTLTDFNRFRAMQRQAFAEYADLTRQLQEAKQEAQVANDIKTAEKKILLQEIEANATLRRQSAALQERNVSMAMQLEQLAITLRAKEVNMTAAHLERIAKELHSAP